MTSIPEYLCPRVKGPIAIDADLDKRLWRDIPPFPPFQLADGRGPASRKTLARACWDAEFLYLAFDCEDPDIWGTMPKHDDPIYQEEVVEVFLSPGGDLTTYYEFEVSPRNIVFDALVKNPTGSRQGMTIDTHWECQGLKTAVRVLGTLDDRSDSDERWLMEMAVPFAALGAPAVKVGDTWRGNLYRIDRTPQPEFSAWSPTLKVPPDYHVPRRFGQLVFVDNLRAR